MYLGYIVDALKTHVFPLPLLCSPLRQSLEKQHTYVHAVKYTCWLYTTQISYVTTQWAWKKTATDWWGLDHARITELVPTVGTNTLTSHTLTNGLNQVKYTHTDYRSRSRGYICILCDISRALLLEKKHCLLVHVSSNMIFEAGRLQILGTDNKCRVVFAHPSKLLIEIHMHTYSTSELPRTHDPPYHTLATQTFHLSVALYDSILNGFNRHPALAWWYFVCLKGNCTTLLAWHLFCTCTRLIGHMA